MIETKDYRSALEGRGPMASQWADKPHRLVFDLCDEIERLRERCEAYKGQVEAGSNEIERLRSGIHAIIAKFEDGENHDEGAFDSDCSVCLILKDLRSVTLPPHEPSGAA